MEKAGVSIHASINHDEYAAVYYFNYGEGGKNWLSFDESVTFQQKIDLANNRGLGGIFTWALDQDDSNLQALRAVTKENYVASPLVTIGYGAFDINDCYITDCGDSCKKGDTTMAKPNKNDQNIGCEGSQVNDRHKRSCMSDHPEPTSADMNSLLSCQNGARSLSLFVARRA